MRALPCLRCRCCLRTEDTIGGNSDDRLPESNVRTATSLPDLSVRCTSRSRSNRPNTDRNVQRFTEPKRLPGSLARDKVSRLVRVGCDERSHGNAEPTSDARGGVPVLNFVGHSASPSMSSGENEASDGGHTRSDAEHCCGGKLFLLTGASFPGKRSTRERRRKILLKDSYDRSQRVERLL